MRPCDKSEQRPGNLLSFPSPSPPWYCSLSPAFLTMRSERQRGTFSSPFPLLSDKCQLELLGAEWHTWPKARNFPLAMPSPSTSCGPKDRREETASVGSHAQPRVPSETVINFPFSKPCPSPQTACVISEWVPLVPQHSCGILGGYKPTSGPKQARYTYHCQDGRGTSGRSLPAPPSSGRQASDCWDLPTLSETTSLNSEDLSSRAQSRLEV